MKGLSSSCPVKEVLKVLKPHLQATVRPSWHLNRTRFKFYSRDNETLWSKGCSSLLPVGRWSVLNPSKSNIMNLQDRRHAPVIAWQIKDGHTVPSSGLIRHISIALDVRHFLLCMGNLYYIEELQYIYILGWECSTPYWHLLLLLWPVFWFKVFVTLKMCAISIYASSIMIVFIVTENIPHIEHFHVVTLIKCDTLLLPKRVLCMYIKKCNKAPVDYNQKKHDIKQTRQIRRHNLIRVKLNCFINTFKWTQ